MDREAMRQAMKPHLAALLGLIVAAPAWSETAPKEEIARPLRLTAGESNQFLGVLGPDGRSLFFVTDQGGTTEIMVQTVGQGGPRPLRDFDADVTGPRPSPDGRRLLFIFYRDDAAGDVCVFELASNEFRCLTDARTADLQAFWFPDGRSIGVVQREGLHGDLVLRRIPVQGGDGEVIATRGMSSPAVSPDGAFVAYIPVDRLTEDVGVNFAMRVGASIEVRRLADGRVFSLKPDLPGVSGFPAFSMDGRFLYFTQYLNDTNGDGTIDGNDHGVLFRVAFDPSAQDPFAGQVPAQLTSARWNCQYPAPARETLILTCSFQGSLDVYSLPLHGSVPETWGVERIEAEYRTSRDHWERLLLAGRAAAMESDPARAVEWLRRMVHLHLEVQEFSSAAFYARAVSRKAAEGSPVAEWASVILELIRHREAESRLVQGQLSERFIEGERKRLERLTGLSLTSRAAVALRDLTVSEVLDVLGEEQKAADALARVDIASLEDWEVVLQAARRATERLELLSDRNGLLALYKMLSAHPALDLSDRLFFANAAVEALLRGQEDSKKPALVEAELSHSDGEYRSRLELERWLLGLGQKDPEEVRKGVFDLYRQAKDLERRRALVLTTAGRAAALDEEYVLYEFSNSFVSWVRRAEPERRYAEDLYRFVVLERAYAKWAKGEVSDARGLFFGATLQSDSLEAHLGAIETRFAEGGTDVIAHYRERYKDQPDHPVFAFVQAYLLARDVGHLADPAAADARVREALAHLRRAADAMPNAFEVQHLWGFLEHQRYLRTRDTQAAADANYHYGLALDLARDHPRATAALLMAMALLQADLGNHAGVVRLLDRRAVWPHLDAAEELAFHATRAESLFRIGREPEAAAEWEKALAMTEGAGDLARFRPLALDRCAMVNFAARRFDRAIAQYDEWLKLVNEPGWNRIRVLLGLGAAALGAQQWERALNALDSAREALRAAPPLPALTEARPRTMEPEDYSSLIAGLRAHAFAGLGRLDGARAEMEAREGFLENRLRRLNVDEDLLELAAAHYHLAQYAWQAGDRARAVEQVFAGLKRVREFEQRTGTVVTPVGLKLWTAYGEMRASGAGADVARDVDQELRRVYEFMATHPNPAWEGDRFLIGLYLGILDSQASSRRNAP